MEPFTLARSISGFNDAMLLHEIHLSNFVTKKAGKKSSLIYNICVWPNRDDKVLKIPECFKYVVLILVAGVANSKHRNASQMDIPF